MGSSPSLNPQTEAAILDQVAILGRKSELRQLLKALTLCRSGQGKAILIAGNEGIGKSALLETFMDIAHRVHGCQTLSIRLPGQLTPQILFIRTVEEILSLAHRILHEALHQANQTLGHIGLRWTQGDLIRIVALMHLQESVGNRQTLVAEQLSQSILSSVPFFKRMNASIKDQIDALAQTLANPWVTLAVSLINPINPQVQNALSLVKQAAGDTPYDVRRLTSGHPGLPLLAGSTTFEPTPAAESTNAQSQEPAPSEEEVEPSGEADSSEAAPSVTRFQSALIGLLAFINNALRSQQTALILAFDQWEALLKSPSTARQEINEMMSELLRQTVDQRDSRLMLIIACRSESESYTVGGSLYNALRVKYLVSPWSFTVQQRFLKDHFKAMDVQVDDQTLQELGRVCQGNPAWLKLMIDTLQTEMTPACLQVLDWDTYQERFSVNHPMEILDRLYTRLQLAFVGEESQCLKALSKLIATYAYMPFKRSQALGLLSQVENGPILMRRLLEALLTQGFLTITQSSPEEESTYQFESAFMLTFLQEKSRPIQEDLPSADKIASLKKVLPLSIQSGELTREKTQEILAMASALEAPDLTQYVEQTLVEALLDEGTITATRIAIMESLSLLTTPAAVDALKHMLQATDPSVRECACLQLVPLAGRAGPSINRRELVEAMIPLTQDEVASIRYHAYEFLALCPSEDTLILPILMEAAQGNDPHVRLVTLTGLSHRRLVTPEVFTIYQHALEQETDLPFVKAILKGLERFDKEKVAPLLVHYLKTHDQSPLWTEVLSHLMNINLGEAFPWIATLLTESEETDTKLHILKRLGSKPNPEVEKILITVLQNAERHLLAPELRWMTIRSLGWIGQSQEGLRVLEGQHGACQRDEILQHALQNAIRQVSERVATFTVNPPEADVPQKQTALFTPVQRLENADSDRLETDEALDYIDLVAVSSD